MSILGAAATGGGQQGIYAVATAIGGVLVSVFTVYKNAQKQAQYTGENTGHIQSLSEQIGMLHSQITELKAENAALTTELRLLKDSHEASQRRRPRDDDYDEYEAPRKRRPRYEDEDDDEDYEPPKKRRPRYDEDDEDYAPPRRKKTQEPPKRRKK